MPGSRSLSLSDRAGPDRSAPTGENGPRGSADSRWASSRLGAAQALVPGLDVGTCRRRRATDTRPMIPATEHESSYPISRPAAGDAAPRVKCFPTRRSRALAARSSPRPSRTALLPEGFCGSGAGRAGGGRGPVPLVSAAAGYYSCIRYVCSRRLTLTAGREMTGGTDRMSIRGRSEFAPGLAIVSPCWRSACRARGGGGAGGGARLRGGDSHVLPAGPGGPAPHGPQGRRADPEPLPHRGPDRGLVAPGRQRLARLVAEGLGRPVGVPHVRRGAGDPERRVPDLHRARDALGYGVAVAVGDGASANREPAQRTVGGRS
jgi:hypothetical protein